MASRSTDSAVTDELAAPPVTRVLVARADAPDSGPCLGKRVGGPANPSPAASDGPAGCLVAATAALEDATGLLTTSPTASAPIV